MKKYLVPYEGSEMSKSALRYAIQFSGLLSGEINIRYIADERVIATPYMDITIAALQSIGSLGVNLPREKARLELTAKLLARGEDLLDEVREWPELKKESNDSHFTTTVEAGHPPKRLTEISPDYDVIFMGLWGEMHKYTAGLWGGTSELVIRKGESPVFLATTDYNPFDSVIVAFDNRPRSRQALAWAGMLGENLEQPVYVVTSGSDEDWCEEVVKEASVIAESYDTEFSYIQTDERAAKAVLKASEEHPDALICLGAFGDQSLRELFLGSVAEEVLRNADSPVFLLK